eukprot:COSAG06_NODE_7037_length_2663_cov_1.815984_3_plen_94_part_00
MQFAVGRFENKEVFRAGNDALVAECEADLLATAPFVHQARNAVAAARAATMQVVAECGGVVQPVNVEYAALVGSTISSDVSSLIKTGTYALTR